MAIDKKYVIGFLLLVILSSGVIYISLGTEGKIRVDKDKTTFYAFQNSRWVVGGREYVKLFSGTKLQYRDKKNIEIKYDINDTRVTITKKTPYKNGAIVIEKYEFDGSIKDIALFPISHTIEVINGTGLILQYEVRDLEYYGDTRIINSPAIFGKKMKVEWEGNPYYHKVFQQKSSDKLVLKWKIENNYKLIKTRLFDPVDISQENNIIYYTGDWYNVNIHLFKKINESYNGSVNSIFVYVEDNNKYKFGAIDNENSGIADYLYKIESDVELIKENNTLYINNQNEKRTFNFSDICSRDYANCSYQFRIENRIDNSTYYAVYIYFKSNSTIDPFLKAIQLKRTQNRKEITLSQNIFRGWNVRSSGNESKIFNVELTKNRICLVPKSKQNRTIKNQTSNQTIIYSVPDEIQLKTDKNTWIVKKVNNKFCYDVDNLLMRKRLKFGAHSITLEGDTVYNSVDTNITQETGFAHLNISKEGLILYLPFDINSSTVYDYSSKNNDGTVNGPTYTSSGKYGGAYDFNGSVENIDMGDKDIFSFPNNKFAFSFWTYANEDTSYKGILCKLNWEYALGYTSGYPTNNYIFKAWSVAGSTVYNTLQTAYTQKVWEHYVYTANGTTAFLYKNGNLVSSTAKTAENMGNGGYPLRIGYSGDAGGNAYFNGTIDEIMIFNRSLNSSEVSEIYNEQYKRFYPNGKMVWKDLDFGNNSVSNITLTNCDVPSGTQLAAQIGNGRIKNFTNCKITDYGLPYNSSNLSIYYTSNADDFFTPLVIGNITLDLDNNNLINCSNIDALTLTTDKNVTFFGNGTVDVYTLNLNSTNQYLFINSGCQLNLHEQIS